AARNPDILFARVNTEKHEPIAAQFNIRSIPTLMIFRSNIAVYAEAGALEASALDQVLGAARALDMEQLRRDLAAEPVRVARFGTPPESVPDREPAAVDASLLSIQTYLRPSLRGPGSVLTQAGRRLAAGGLVAIPNAFEPDFAERMYRSLDG